MAAAAETTGASAAQPHLLRTRLLWTFPKRRCILFFKDYLYSSSYNSHNLQRIVNARVEKAKLTMASGCYLCLGASVPQPHRL